jgi:arabinogalactan endo-1,4-beta-galactosidase
MNRQILLNVSCIKEIHKLLWMPWDSAPECKLFLTDLIAKVKSISNNKGLGVLYWEPQTYGGWNGYSLGAFDKSGKPTIAMDAFKD